MFLLEDIRVLDIIFVNKKKWEREFMCLMQNRKFFNYGNE